MSLVKSLVKNRSGVASSPAPPESYVLISENSDPLTTEGSELIELESAP